MAEDEVAELFCCSICEDLMLAPTTLVCCGRSFCKECLHLWIKTNAQQGGIPRCPGGCMAKVPFRLPKHSIALRKAMEQLVPDRLACRIKEAEEEEEEMPCFGGFKAWTEIAASRDILYGSSIIVRQGSPGIVVGNCDDGCHLTVKFDEREDGSELCVNVVPEALMLPLPGGFRLHQRVVALYELLLNSDMKVPLGSVGHIIGSLGGDRVTVLFEPKQEKIPEYPVSVNIREVAAQRPLVGGFSIAQRVQASMSLVVGNKVVVHAGCRGTVLAEFSDTRLTVVFETSEAAPNCFNVLPLEILPWCDTPPEFPAGTSVRAVHHLMSPCAIIVHAGTRGIILGGVDPSLVFVSFENGPAVAAAISALETDTDAVGETACLGGSLESGREEPETCLERSETMAPEAGSSDLSSIDPEASDEEAPDSTTEAGSGFACAVSTPINSARATVVLNTD
ncbi:unnamed protein product [Effrenium voratum]|uniref:RING-type domain-containing protein n=1 Tax=Effrenium voratum TaxID=2562239 RepID=A0AA36MH89_9DINO|nr:unnamed protein product [Effrenium voratum]CAJ1371939.1 unnamed protein product [Effrenium voratum]CAJ1451418.1 unnamed protein product [Effrenium voratum]|mmetsp:Transcript_101081/g.240888  ORF Transcript_101081/g.240888 Transcript_101081/m.240888 type:complete len:451 (+) Transcript_101081:76-1428(+)